MKLRKTLNILLLIILSGCIKSPISNPYIEITSTNTGQIVKENANQTHLVTDVVEIDDTLQDPAVMLTPIELTKKPTPCLDFNYHSKEIDASQIWWQFDSKALLFQNRSEEEGSFDFLSNKITFDLSLPNPYGRIPDQIRKSVPIEIENNQIYLSPSSRKAIYRVPYIVKPTATPQIIGEPSGEPEVYFDLFWLGEEKAESAYLGRVENFIHQVYWSQDENFVLLGTGPSLYTTSILLVDLEIDFIKQITIEIAKNNTKSLYPIDFTPDSHSFLFRINEDIYRKNIQTGNEIELEIPLFRYHWWISEQNFIAIIDDDKHTPYNSGIYVYDIKNMILSKISNTPIQSDANFIPNSVLLSPDKTKIGYIDMDYHLNVIEFCPEFLLSDEK